MNLSLYYVLSKAAVILQLIVTPECKETNILTKRCQWEVAHFASRSRCTDRCDKYEGFVDPSTNKLICFYKSTRAVPIYRSDYTKSDSTIKVKCECGHKKQRTIQCDPRIIYENITYSECLTECGKLTAYFSMDRKSKKLSYCGDASKLIFLKLDSLTVAYNVLVNNEQSNYQYLYECYCGLGISNESVNVANQISEKDRGKGSKYPKARKIIKEKKINKMSNYELDLVSVCPIGTFVRNGIKECLDTCQNLKGMHIPNSNHFICFNEMEKAEVIKQVSQEYYECGIYLRNRSYHTRQISHRCNPEIKFPINSVTMDQSEEKCNSYSALIFSFGYNLTVYCEPLVTDVYDKLDYKIGKRNIVTSESGKTRGLYDCQCGVRLSLPEIEPTDLIIVNDINQSFTNQSQINRINQSPTNQLRGSDFLQKEFGSEIDNFSPNNYLGRTNETRNEDQLSRSLSQLDSYLLQNTEEEDLPDDNEILDSFRIRDSSIDIPDKPKAVKRKSRQIGSRSEETDLVSICPNGTFVRSGIKKCLDTCQNLKGMHIPNSDHFICFNEMEKAKVIKQVSQEYYECGMDLRNSSYRTRQISYRCNPEIKFPINSFTMDQSEENCNSYFALIFRLGRILTVHCEPLVSNVHEKLDYKIGKRKIITSRSGKILSEYDCQCGVRLSLPEIEPTDFIIGNDINQSFTNQSQINRINQSLTNETRARDQFNATIIHDTNQSRINQLEINQSPANQSRGSDRLQNEFGSERNNFSPNNYLGRTNETRNEDQLSRSLSQLDSYLLQNTAEKDLPDDNEILDSFRIRDSSIDISDKPKAVKRKSRQIDSDSEETEPFKASCSIGKFKIESKMRCANVCETAKGFFPPFAPNEFVCFHHERAAEVISFSNNTCVCGAIFSKYKKYNSKYSCVPEVKYENVFINCRLKCKAHTIYIFYTGRRTKTISYCAMKNFEAIIYEKLHSKMEKKRTAVFSKAERTCECGLDIIPNNFTQNVSEDAGRLSYNVGLERRSARCDKTNDLFCNFPGQNIRHNEDVTFQETPSHLVRQYDEEIFQRNINNYNTRRNDLLFQDMFQHNPIHATMDMSQFMQPIGDFQLPLSDLYFH